MSPRARLAARRRLRSRLESTNPLLARGGAELGEEDQRHAAAARDRLAEFIRHGWHVLEPEVPLEWNWHIEAVADHLQAVFEDWLAVQEWRRDPQGPIPVQRIQNLLINIPPGTGKSRIVSVFFPAWAWLHCPSWRAIFLSANPRVADRDSDLCRTLITSDWYREWFRPEWKLRPERNALRLFANTAGGWRQAMGITAAITGERADALVVDDPHDAQKANSEADREMVLARWDNAIANRVNDPRSSVRIGIMQRLHAEDWSGHVLAQGGWEHLCLPLEFEPARAKATAIGWSDPRTEEGEVLHPARFTPEVIAGEKTRLGPYGTAGQLQQRPAPAEGGILKKAWFLRYQARPQRFDEVILSWDLTFKETRKGSYVCGQAWGRIGANAYLLAEYRGRIDYVASKELFLRSCKEWPAAALKLVEDKANGPALQSDLSKTVSGIVLFPVAGDKVERAYAETPQLAAGNVFVPDPDLFPWVREYLDEVCTFPNAPNDDRVDVTTQALRYFRTHPLPSSGGFTTVRR